MSTLQSLQEDSQRGLGTHEHPLAAFGESGHETGENWPPL